MDICKIKSPHRETWGNCSKLDLHATNVYGPMVKVTGWEKHTECLPIDVDPYNPIAFDLHNSHYNRMGGDKSPVNYRTTTQDMLEEVYDRKRHFEINPNKVLFNLTTDINIACEDAKPKVCSSPYGTDYMTTMQRSFQPPYPYLLQRLSMAQTPYFLNRHLKAAPPGKFWDEDYKKHTQTLQKYKSKQHISFNPCTGLYTDGSVGDLRGLY